MLAALGILAACARETVPQVLETSESNASTITVRAAMAGTRTVMTEDENGFSFKWKDGDQIAIIENCLALEDSPCWTYASIPLSVNDNDPEEGVFTVHLDDREDFDKSEGLSYTAVYPYDNGWTIPWGYRDDYRQFFIGMMIPTRQYPSADCFDPDADILVSKPVYRSNRPGDSEELTFQFARMGTIVKMVLNGLPPRSELRNGEVDFGFQGAFWLEYNPEEMVVTGNDGSETMFFSFQGRDGDEPGLTVSEDGRAVVWLRTISGVTDYIDVRLNQSGMDNWARHRHVSFRAKGQKLEFKEGGLTSFTINFATPLVENPDPETVQYLTNAAMNGVTVSWPAPDNEHLAGYEAFLMDEDDHSYPASVIEPTGDETCWKAVVSNGLAAGEYTFYLRALAVDPKGSQPEYLEKDISIGILQDQTISGESIPGWYTENQNYEITSGDVLFGYRNMSHGTGWSASPSATMPWAFWNKTPLHMGILRVTPSSSYMTTDFQVYASDDPFVDGLPPATDEQLLTYTEENGYKEFSLGGKKYFLMTGQIGLWLNGIYMEYYH